MVFFYLLSYGCLSRKASSILTNCYQIVRPAILAKHLQRNLYIFDISDKQFHLRMPHERSRREPFGSKLNVLINRSQINTTGQI